MKIIVAGFSKTGTKSLSAALRELGYEVYDFLEHFWYHGEAWKKIKEGKWTIDDFKEMYKNVDVTIDTPTFFFWEEIHQAFPDAKVTCFVFSEFLELNFKTFFSAGIGTGRLISFDWFHHQIIPCDKLIVFSFLKRFLI